MAYSFEAVRCSEAPGGHAEGAKVHGSGRQGPLSARWTPKVVQLRRSQEIARAAAK